LFISSLLSVTISGLNVAHATAVSLGDGAATASGTVASLASSFVIFSGAACSACPA